MKRPAKTWLVRGVCAVMAGALVALVVANYHRLFHVPQDLRKLAPYAATQNYTVLFRDLAAHPPTATGFTFAVLGDTRSNLFVAKDVLSHALAEHPRFILHTGDLVQKGLVNEFLTHHLELVKMAGTTPLIPVPGNHEKGPNKDFAAFKALYGADRFSFDFDRCRFVGVNNVAWNGMSAADLEYLNTELAKPGVAHRFVVFHRPPHFIKHDRESEDGGRGFTWHASELRALMTKDHVDEVFVGHIHGFASEMIDGVRYTITGGGGAPLAKTLGKEGDVWNYIVVHVSPQGLTNTALRLIGGKWTRTLIG